MTSNAVGQANIHHTRNQVPPTPLLEVTRLLFSFHKLPLQTIRKTFLSDADANQGRRLVGSGDHSMCEQVVAAVLWGHGVGGESSHHLCGAGAEAERRPCG